VNALASNANYASHIALYIYVVHTRL